jgi:OOP family OmpA-OmpF porin
MEYEMKKQLLVALVGVALAVPFAAQAEGAYVGVNVGRAKQKVTFDGESASESKTGYKLYGGYGFTKNFGMEAGYVNFGKFEESFDDGVNSGSASYKPTSLYVAGTASLPLNDQFSLFAKLGMTANRAKVSATLNGVSESQTETNTTALIGVGAAYNISRELSLVAEYENFGNVVKGDSGHVKADMFSVGLRYKF